jgi:small ligand-binding sensory domain FIST
VAIAGPVPEGTRLTFSERNAAAARADLMRMCAEIREELETESVSDEQWADPLQAEPARPILGAIYISCIGRGGPHFGQPNAELQIVRHALGDVPLVGFFASGEIAHRQVYGYSGVLTVFVG